MNSCRILKSRDNKNILVSEEDFDYLYKYIWSFRPSGHIIRNGWDKNNRKNKTIYIHSEIMTRNNIERPENYVIDHINRDPSDNRRENLRFVPRSVNSYNRGSKTVSDNPFRGVFFKKQCNKWFANIHRDGKRLAGKYCDTLEEAIYYRQLFEKQYWGDHPECV